MRRDGPIPCRGTPVAPIASMRRIVSKRRLDTSSRGSNSIPANRGRQNDSIIRSENPALTSRSRVVVSGRRSSSRTECVRTSKTSRARRALSLNVPIGAPIVSSICSGRRIGSLTRWKPPRTRTIAPGSK
jgi:hypothetical protein